MIIFTQIKTNFLISEEAITERINNHSVENIPFFLLVDYEKKHSQFYTMQDLVDFDIQIQFPHYSNYLSSQSLQADIYLKPLPLTFEDYQSKFNIVMNHLQYGNSYLTNLTAETPVRSNASMIDIFHAAKATYKIRYKNNWICFSPETFIKIKNGHIYAYPMKGTIDASIPNAHNIILKDPKELAEHFTIVDLIRNDLSRVATEVQVKQFRYINEIKTQHKTLLQVSSEIEGKLPEAYANNLASILFNLLPAGSISGAPKSKTLEIITEAEKYQRGFYTGVAFYLMDMNWIVAY